MQEENVKQTQTEAAEEQVQKEEAKAQEATDKAAEEKTNEPADKAPDAKDEQITDLQNRLLRLQADFDNFRRRTNQEKEQLSTFVTAGVIEKFLKVLDNFERAEASAESTQDLEGLLKGMKAIRRQFEDAFKVLGVEEIPAQDQKFDPNLHEAVMRAQNPDMEDDTVDMVFEKGYKLREKVIRHSKVRVINND